MHVICLEEPALFSLVEEVVARIKEKNNIKEDRWISGEEAMKRLRIKSKTSLQQLRDLGKIRFSNPSKKVILYDTESINSYLEKHAKETF
jgi:hypothetical protein